MASTINAGNGPYIVIPQQNMHTAVPATGPSTQEQGFYLQFLKGQPKVLGTTQIMVAFLYISLGTVLLFTIDSFVSISTYSGISYWGAVFYIISGSLSIAAANKQSVELIRGSLAMNVISALVSLTAIGLYCTDIPYAAHNFNPPCYSLCGVYSDTVYIFVIANEYQNPAVNFTGNANLHSVGQNVNTLGGENIRIPMVSTAIPEVHPTLPQPDYIPSNRNVASVYPAPSTTDFNN